MEIKNLVSLKVLEDRYLKDIVKEAAKNVSTLCDLKNVKVKVFIAEL